MQKRRVSGDITKDNKLDFSKDHNASFYLWYSGAVHWSWLLAIVILLRNLYQENVE